MKQSYSRILNALKVERMRKSLSTRFERESLKEATRSALTRAYYSNAMIKEIPADGHSHPSIAISQDGSLLAIGAGNILKVIRTFDAKELWRKETDSSDIGSLAFSADNERLYIMDWDSESFGNINIFDCQNGEFVRRLASHVGRRGGYAHHHILFLDESSDVIWAQEWNAVNIRKISTGELIKGYSWSPVKMEEVVLSRDRKTLMALGTDDAIRIWDTELNTIVQTLKPNGLPHSLAMSPDGHTLAFSIVDGIIETYSPNEEGEWTADSNTYEAPGALISKISYGKDSQTLYVTYDNGSTRVWSDADKTYAEHSEAAMLVLPFPDQQRMITTSADGTIRIWHLNIARPKLRFAKALEGKYLYLLDNGKKVVAGTWEGIQTLDLESG